MRIRPALGSTVVMVIGTGGMVWAIAGDGSIAFFGYLAGVLILSLGVRWAVREWLLMRQDSGRAGRKILAEHGIAARGGVAAVLVAALALGTPVVSLWYQSHRDVQWRFGAVENDDDTADETDDETANPRRVHSIQGHGYVIHNGGEGPDGRILSVLDPLDGALLWGIEGWGRNAYYEDDIVNIGQDGSALLRERQENAVDYTLFDPSGDSRWEVTMTDPGKDYVQVVHSLSADHVVLSICQGVELGTWPDRDDMRECDLTGIDPEGNRIWDRSMSISTVDLMNLGAGARHPSVLPPAPALLADPGSPDEQIRLLDPETGEDSLLRPSLRPAEVLGSESADGALAHIAGDLMLTGSDDGEPCQILAYDMITRKQAWRSACDLSESAHLLGTDAASPSRALILGASHTGERVHAVELDDGRMHGIDMNDAEYSAVQSRIPRGEAEQLTKQLNAGRLLRQTGSAGADGPADVNRLRRLDLPGTDPEIIAGAEGTLVVQTRAREVNPMLALTKSPTHLSVIDADSDSVLASTFTHDGTSGATVLAPGVAYIQRADGTDELIGTPRPH